MSEHLFFLGPTFDYGDRRRGFSYEHRNFHPALKRFCARLGWSFTHYDYHVRGQALGQPVMTEELYELVKLKRPTYLFSVLFDLDVDPYYEVFRQVSDQFGTVTVNWFCDDHWRYDQYSARVAPKFDFYCTTSTVAAEKYHRDGLGDTMIKTQWGCDEIVYRPIEVREDMDMSFVGQPHGDRAEIVDAIRRQGMDLKVFGYGWKETTRLPFNQMLRIFSRSRINLNLSNSSQSAVQQLKGRNFEIPACAGFLLTPRVEGLDDYFEIDKEVVTFESIEELLDKARYYLARPALRRRVAVRGHRRVLAEHTWRHRFSDIFARLRDRARSASSRSGRYFASGGLAAAADGPDPGTAPGVSIVVPCYNQGRYLPDAVSSIVWQSYQDWELIIVNDGSTDDSEQIAREVISRYPGRSIRLLSQENTGLSAARNAGMGQARGDFLLPLDADDMLRCDALEKMAAKLDQMPGIDIVYPNAMRFGTQYGRLNAQPFDFRKLCTENILFYSALFRRNVWEKCGGYKPVMRIGYEDWEYWITCAENEFRFYHLSAHLLLYRVKEHSMIVTANKDESLLKATIVSLHPGLYARETREWAASVRESQQDNSFASLCSSNAPRLRVDMSVLRRPGISFCIITNGKRPQLLARQINNIRSIAPSDHEIIIAGEVPYQFDDVSLISAASAAREGRLGALRNMAIAAARYDTLVVVDDDILFHQDFARALLARHGRHEMLCARLVNLDGTRYWDWATTSGPGGQELLDYDADHPGTYMTGGLSILPARLCDEIQWNPTLGYGQHEDVDLSSRLKALGHSLQPAPECLAWHCSLRYTQVGRQVLKRSQRGAENWLRDMFESLDERQLIDSAVACLEQNERADAADYLRACLQRFPSSKTAQRIWRQTSGTNSRDESVREWRRRAESTAVPGTADLLEVADEVIRATEQSTTKPDANEISATTQLPKPFTFGDGGLRCATGTLVDNFLYCTAARHVTGHCVFGPYVPVRCRRELIVSFMVTPTGPPEGPPSVLCLDVYDAGSDTMIAFRSVDAHGLEINRQVSLSLPFVTSIGQILEFRLHWDGGRDIMVSGVELDKPKSSGSMTTDPVSGDELNNRLSI